MDDDFMVWKSGIEFLKLYSHEVSFCQTTDDAVEEFERHEFDLVFLDVNIAPGEYFAQSTHNEDRYVGLIVARHFRKVESALGRPPAKMLFYTNWDDNTTISIASTELGIQYMEKPINLEVLKGLTSEH
jgi:two-component SAPR family response regulator